MKRFIVCLLVLVLTLVPVSTAWAWGGNNENVDHVRFRCTTHPEFEINDGVPLFSFSLTYPLIWDEIKAHRAEHTLNRRVRVVWRMRGRRPIYRYQWVRSCDCRIEIAEMDADNNVVEVVTSNYIPSTQR